MKNRRIDGELAAGESGDSRLDDRTHNEQDNQADQPHGVIEWKHVTNDAGADQRGKGDERPVEDHRDKNGSEHRANDKKDPAEGIGIGAQHDGDLHGQHSSREASRQRHGNTLKHDSQQGRKQADSDGNGNNYYFRLPLHQVFAKSHPREKTDDANEQPEKLPSKEDESEANENLWDWCKVKLIEIHRQRS